nr:hypothetical protein [Tanacetum cinerariifolium]
GIGEVGYGIRDTWIDPAEIVHEITPMIVGEVNTRVTELVVLHEHDIQDLYALFEDAHDSRTRISQRVVVDSQRTEIAKLRETDRRRQAQMAETLRVMGDIRREIGDMQAELLALRGQPRRAGQPLGDARVPNHQEAPRDADRTEGVVSLTRWIEKMESVFQISSCTIENQKCHKCNKVGHFARNCRSSGNTNVANAQRNNGAHPKGNGCFECGATGHFKRDCPKLKNKDREKGNAQGWV